MWEKLKTWVLGHKIEASLLLGILILGAFLRLWQIDQYMTFLGDEGRDVLVVKRMIVDHKFTLLGPTASVGGFFLGPIYYYLMLPFLWLFRFDPVGPAVMVGLFGVATIFLIYKVGRDCFDSITGLIAASLYTVSPLVIVYSRSSWNPNLMPFFSLLIVCLTWKIVTQKRWPLLFWLGICFGILFQLHYLAVFLAAIILIYLLIFGEVLKHIKNYLWGILGFFIGWAPFLAFELRHDFPNFKTLWKFIFSSDEVGFVSWNFGKIAGDVGLRLFSRLVTFNNEILAKLIIVLSVLVFGYLWVTSFKKKALQFKTVNLLVFWLIGGAGFFVFYQKPIYDYYFGFMFALPFLLAGKTFSFLSQRIVGKLLVTGVLFYLLWLNWEGRPFKFKPNRQLEQTRQISRLVLEKTEGKPFNFALITGQNSDHAYRYFLEIWGAKPVVVENFQVDPERKTATDQLLVVCESLPCQPRGHSLWEIAGFGRAEIVGEWEVSVVKVYKLVHYKGP